MDALIARKNDSFGSMMMPFDIITNKYKINPIIPFEDTIHSLRDCINRDGFIYPPYSETWKVNPFSMEKKEKVPNSGRPANLYRPLPTHTIVKTHGTDLDVVFRINEGALILRLMDVIYETQLQFHDWWWVGRVRMDQKLQEWLTKEELEKAISQALDTWSGWDPDKKRVYLNCCFNFARAISYEWPYEQFIALYICIDAIWWLHFGRDKGNGHSQRLNKILEVDGLHQNPTIVGKIVDIRNSLFHEGVWGTFYPMSGGPENMHTHVRQLKEIVQRCLLKSIGLTNHFIFTNWEGFRGWTHWNDPRDR